jgi:hypothetical protein
MSVFRTQQQLLHAHAILLAPLGKARTGQPLAPGSMLTVDEKVLTDYAAALRDYPDNHHLFIAITKALEMQHEQLRAMATELVKALTPPGGNATSMDEWIKKWGATFNVDPPLTN